MVDAAAGGGDDGFEGDNGDNGDNGDSGDLGFPTVEAFVGRPSTIEPSEPNGVAR